MFCTLPIYGTSSTISSGLLLNLVKLFFIGFLILEHGNQYVLFYSIELFFGLLSKIKSFSLCFFNKLANGQFGFCFVAELLF